MIRPEQFREFHDVRNGVDEGHFQRVGMMLHVHTLLDHLGNAVDDVDAAVVDDVCMVAAENEDIDAEVEDHHDEE